MIGEEKKPLDIYIGLLPEIEDILDLKTPGQLLLIRPDNIDHEVKTTSGLILTHTDEVKQRVLAKGTVVCHGSGCQDIHTDDIVYFYKPESKGSFKAKNSEGVYEVYQLYQEYSIHAYITPIKK